MSKTSTITESDARKAIKAIKNCQTLTELRHVMPSLPEAMDSYLRVQEILFALTNKTRTLCSMTAEDVLVGA